MMAAAPEGEIDPAAGNAGVLTTSHTWRRKSLQCLAIAIVAGLTTFFLFAPRLSFWPALDYPETTPPPEVGRAQQTLVQVNSPWQSIDSPLHRIIAWRLFFPVVWHYCHMPARLLLVMPFLGCVLALWLAAWLTYQRLGNVAQTLLATTLFATLPWFFVSTGWLAYFDSWLVLGLLVAAFVPSRAALVAACLVTPWIDERFVLALPLTAVIRVVAPPRTAAKDAHDFRPELVAMLITGCIYLAIRALAQLGGEQVTSEYLHRYAAEARAREISSYLRGLWSGFRGAWIFIAASIILVACKRGLILGVLCALLSIISAIGGLVVATDMSRTMMLLAPLMLLGIWLLADQFPDVLKWLLPGVILVNMLWPATHEVGNESTQLRWLPTEIAQLRAQPDWLRAAQKFREGAKSLEQGDHQRAIVLFTEAVALDDRLCLAYVQRAVAEVRAGDIDAATADVERALRVDSDDPYAHYLRAVLRARRGDRGGAIDDLQQTLLHAPENWPHRAEAKAALQQLQGH